MSTFAINTFVFTTLIGGPLTCALLMIVGSWIKELTQPIDNV